MASDHLQKKLGYFYERQNLWFHVQQFFPCLLHRDPYGFLRFCSLEQVVNDVLLLAFT
jgi:hypothetical protein